MIDLHTLQDHGESLFSTARELSLLGVPFNRRMPILRRADGALMLHSPFVPQAAVLTQLEQLGHVDALVVSTCFHSTFVAESIARWPSATCYVCEGATGHAAGSENVLPLSELAPEWRRVVTPLRLGGMPKVNEYVFHQAASRSLLVSDLLFSIGESPATWTRIFAKLMGFGGGPSSSRLFRMMVKEPEAFAASLDQALLWDFDRIVPSHFSVVNSGGKAIVRDERARYS